MSKRTDSRQVTFEKDSKKRREKGGREGGKKTYLDTVATSSKRGWEPLTASRRKRRAGEAESSSSGSAGMAARARTRA